jgi:hypothetical protein
VTTYTKPLKLILKLRGNLAVLVGQIVNKMPTPRLSKEDSQLVDSSTLLGIEVEVEKCTKYLPETDTCASYWTMHEDNSLRDNGREFVFSEPLYGADVVQAVKYLCDQAKAKKWAISERTGLHVHIDVRNMDVDKFRNFNTLYAITEKIIYNWVGDGRERNIHCLPWFIADLDLDIIGEIFTKSPTHAQSVIKNLNRYAGWNLASLTKFGTVEARHLKTTFDFERIMTWLNILLSLKKAALKWEGTADQLIKEAKVLGGYGMLTRVFGYTLSQKLWYQDLEVEMKEYGIPTALHFLATSKKDEKTTPSDQELFNRFTKLANFAENDEYGECEFLKKWKEKHKRPESKGPLLNRRTKTYTQVLGTSIPVPHPPPQPISVGPGQGHPVGSSEWFAAINAISQQQQAAMNLALSQQQAAQVPSSVWVSAPIDDYGSDIEEEDHI